MRTPHTGLAAGGAEIPASWISGGDVGILPATPSDSPVEGTGAKSVCSAAPSASAPASSRRAASQFWPWSAPIGPKAATEELLLADEQRTSSAPLEPAHATTPRPPGPDILLSWTRPSTTACRGGSEVCRQRTPRHSPRQHHRSSSIRIRIRTRIRTRIRIANRMGILDDAASVLSARTSHAKRSKSHRSSRHPRQPSTRHRRNNSRSRSRSRHRSSRSAVGGGGGGGVADTLRGVAAALFGSGGDEDDEDLGYGTDYRLHRLRRSRHGGYEDGSSSSSSDDDGVLSFLASVAKSSFFSSFAALETTGAAGAVVVVVVVVVVGGRTGSKGIDENV
ncbi:hypothetical protein VTH06DRAFT_8189 [Thermothelomyces fergusii]